MEQNNKNIDNYDKNVPRKYVWRRFRTYRNGKIAFKACHTCADNKVITKIDRKMEKCPVCNQVIDWGDEKLADVKWISKSKYHTQNKNDCFAKITSNYYLIFNVNASNLVNSHFERCDVFFNKDTLMITIVPNINGQYSITRHIGRRTFSICIQSILGEAGNINKGKRYKIRKTHDGVSLKLERKKDNG